MTVLETATRGFEVSVEHVVTMIGMDMAKRVVVVAERIRDIALFDSHLNTSKRNEPNRTDRSRDRDVMFSDVFF